jgi:hypothetical protein
MSISIGTIRSNLKTVISNLVTSTTVAVVYDYFEPSVSGYPVIMFDITNNTDEYLTNKENLLKITFSAYILVEIFQNEVEDATRLLDTVTDALIVELRKEANISLSGAVDWISPVVGPRQQVETPRGMAFQQQLDIVLNVADTI